LKQTSTEEELAQIEKNMLSTIVLEIKVIVESYAAQNGFSHIINENSGSLFHFDRTYDVTGDILKLYDQRNEDISIEKTP